MASDNVDPAGAGQGGRWTLIRDVAVFQFKVFVDGVRDLLLVPLSLLAALVGLVTGGRRPGTEFYDLLVIGRRSERWINLFGAADRVYGAAEDHEQGGGTDIDRLAARIERFVVDEYRKGGLTGQARERLDRAIDRLQEAARRRP